MSENSDWRSVQQKYSDILDRFRAERKEHNMARIFPMRWKIYTRNLEKKQAINPSSDGICHRGIAS